MKVKMAFELRETKLNTLEAANTHEVATMGSVGKPNHGKELKIKQSAPGRGTSVSNLSDLNHWAELRELLLHSLASLDRLVHKMDGIALDNGNGVAPDCDCIGGAVEPEVYLVDERNTLKRSVAALNRSLPKIQRIRKRRKRKGGVVTLNVFRKSKSKETNPATTTLLTGNKPLLPPLPLGLRGGKRAVRHLKGTELFFFGRAKERRGGISGAPSWQRLHKRKIAPARNAGFILLLPKKTLVWMKGLQKPKVKMRFLWIVELGRDSGVFAFVSLREIDY